MSGSLSTHDQQIGFAANDTRTPRQPIGALMRDEYVAWSAAEDHVIELNIALPTNLIVAAIGRCGGYRRSVAAIETRVTKIRARLGLKGTHVQIEWPEEPSDNYAVVHEAEMATGVRMRSRFAWNDLPLKRTVQYAVDGDGMHVEDEVWESTLRPNCRFSSYSLLRATLMP